MTADQTRRDLAEKSAMRNKRLADEEASALNAVQGECTLGEIVERMRLQPRHAERIRGVLRRLGAQGKVETWTTKNGGRRVRLYRRVGV